VLTSWFEFVEYIASRVGWPVRWCGPLGGWLRYIKEQCNINHVSDAKHKCSLQSAIMTSQSTSILVNIHQKITNRDAGLNLLKQIFPYGFVYLDI